MTKQERCAYAFDCHASGLNCAQSVLAAFTEETGLSDELSLAICSGFGFGMRCGSICGVVAAATVALGMCYPHTRENGAEGKRRSGELTKEFEARFMNQFGNLECRELKANPTGDGTEMAKALNCEAHCRKMVVSGTELLHDMLSELKEK